ncbi:MAG: VWA domain-containing protein [Gammaproteobacteria bacterium]
MRRLPVYLLLDNSGSMMGEAIEAVKNGVQVLASTLRQDPYALETAFISVITFNTEAKQVVPLTDLISFQPPDIVAQGTTSLGAALKLVSKKINEEVITTTPGRRGDWKPLIFLMTDGAPTDDWQSGLDDLKKIKLGMIVACAAGPNGDTNVLKSISETVVQLDTADSGTIKKFFQWISASISTTSQKIDLNKKDPSAMETLPPPPPEVNFVT